MTTLTDTQIITASGGLVELAYATNTAASGVTVSASPTTLISDTTVVCDGGPILVEFYAPYYTVPNNATNNYGGIQLYVDGAASNILAEPFYTPSAIGQVLELGPIKTSIRITPSAGSHTIGIRATKGANNWTVGSGNGTGTNYLPMWMRVSKIVQATQWPAVTTGTIICTSSTRPASPFEGQTIYETDTQRYYTYRGAAWVFSPIGRVPVCLLSKNIVLTSAGILWEFTAPGDEITDPENMHSTSSNTARVTPPIAGVYKISASVDNGEGNVSMALVIRKSGSNIATSAPDNATFFTAANASVMATANGSTDYFDVVGYSSTNKTYGCRLSVAYAGPIT